MTLTLQGRTRLRLATIFTALLALLATGAIGAVSADASPQGCHVDYKVTAEWNGGFIADVKVTNLGDDLDGWELEWAFPSGQQVTQAWSADIASSDADATARNLSYNSRITTDETVSFGFAGTWSGANATPTSFTLNGVLCDGTISDPSVTPSPGGELNAMETVAAMEPGWNVGNTLDAIPEETSWGNPPITEELLDFVKASGYKSIRLPVTWTDYIGEAPDHTIDQARLDRVTEVVDWAIERDLYVLLNLHHDSWMWINATPTDHDAVVAKYDAVWTQLADRFKDHSELLVLESINEPQYADATDEEGDAYNDELNRLFHEIVRGSGGKNADRLLVLPTLHTSGEQARLDALTATIDELDDDMIAATVHFYGWWPFSVNIAGGTRYDENVEDDIVGTFGRVHDTFVANGIPVIIGEWGTLAYDYTRPGIIQHGELLKFYEAVQFQARDKDVTLMLWDAGSFVNRNTLQMRDQHLHEWFVSSWTSRSGTASFDSIYLDNSAAIESRSLTLNRNGLEFEGLWHGDTELAEGSDYTVTGDTLTVTSSALTRLSGDRAHGVNTSIEARFSDGMPWQIYIIGYDTPVLADATGTTESFAIPAQFTGDRLATMESVYAADETPTEPATWTPFKEFWSTFQPDYEAGTILLKPALLNELDDGQTVRLTFHFWGAGEVAYEITKNGTSVTGSAL
ncbi:cellulase family glycosylhydrolase [Myceligenerans xiligouense]|uniref:cellulase n=1 Tax=Myceligenerans xiligouense TaxID=253184 RepID=A0A3N4YP77_9MICO|nr:cellulase family glycosylhydrolase [Myceligenerans xiligouense]RPF22423.1 aryl-phospho-beta-D-glucosidase BglC (GH1 family) [Myceligenerans xiligouense]